MSPDQRLVLPIAPSEPESKAAALISHKPAASKAVSVNTPQSENHRSPQPAGSEQPQRPKVTGLTVSRQWVLPPRPKPGRKPKPKPAKPPSKTATRIQARKQQIELQTQQQHQQQQHQQPNETQDEGNCMLCSRDDCMCETIGLKEKAPPSGERRRTLPSLDSILNGPPLKMDAVPLKRPRSDLPRGEGVTKFLRTEPREAPSAIGHTTGLQPMQPRHILTVPSPLEGLRMVTDSCGFCTENTPCACAEMNNAEMNQSQLPPLPQQPSRRPSSETPPTGLQTPATLSPKTTVATITKGYAPSSSYVHQHQHPQQQQQLPTAPPSISSPSTDDACALCSQDAMSMLFCLSLAASSPLQSESVAIPCHLAFKTLQKHPRFEGCDLGKLVRRLEVSFSRQVGVQSINRVLQELERGDFNTPKF